MVIWAIYFQIRVILIVVAVSIILVVLLCSPVIIVRLVVTTIGSFADFGVPNGILSSARGPNLLFAPQGLVFVTVSKHASVIIFGQK
jgi:hypothetical protein